MTREEKILCKVDKNLIGIEIGPSHAPIAAKKNGFKVHIIDHMSKDQLIEKYKTHGVNLSNIETVDFIWDGNQTYGQLTGKRGHYKWIIASHVIEHTPDFITFLRQCEEVLAEDGILSLAVPDIRYHFDYFRPISGISKIIDAYLGKNIIHTAGTAAEYYLNITTRGGKIAWEQGFENEFSLLSNCAEAYSEMNRIIQKRDYLDLHAWSFTATSFRLLIQDLNDLRFTSFREVAFFPTTGCEFFITLGKKGDGFQHNRLDTLKKIKTELSV